MRMNTERGQLLVASEAGTPPRRAARQPFATAKKIAFWAAVVGGIASLGGNITLLLLTGSVSVTSALILLCWLASVVTLATKADWTRLVSSLLGVSILYLLLTTPYVIEHLSNPNAPDGGIGTFIGDVLVIACALLVFGGSLVTLLQNYWRKPQ